MVDNLNEFSRDYQEEHQRAGRVALAWDGDGAFTADYFFEIGKIESTPIYYQVPALVAPPDNPFGGIPGYDASGKPAEHTWRPVDLPLSSGEYNAHGLTLTWDVSDNFTIKSLTGYRELDDDIYQNYTSAFSTPGSPFPTEFVDIRYARHRAVHPGAAVPRQLRRALRLPGRPLLLQGGGRSLPAHRHRYSAPVIPTSVVGPIAIDKDRDIDAESESKAVFAQVTWTPAILDDRLGADLRRPLHRGQSQGDPHDVQLLPAGRLLDSHRVSSPTPFCVPLGNSIDEDFSKFNPAFTANMAWTTDVSTYLRIATGYKAGGISEAGAVGTFNSDFVFEPEEILTYELGLKSMLADDRVRLNMAVFYSEFDDMQLGFNTNPADLSEVLLTNAGEATVSGVEIEGQWAATDDLQFSFNYTYLDPEIDRVDAPAGTIFDPAFNSAVAVPGGRQHRGTCLRCRTHRRTVIPSRRTGPLHNSARAPCQRISTTAGRTISSPLRRPAPPSPIASFTRSTHTTRSMRA